MGRKTRGTRIADISGRGVRRHSTATVLFHAAVAERLGLGPTDHKCLDLLRDRGSMTGSELAAVTGLTTGAITGVVVRLERAGYLQRAPHPDDGRKQLLSPATSQASELERVFAPIRDDLTALLETFDADQLSTVAEFLDRSTDMIYRHAGRLRAESLSAAGPQSPPRPTRARGQ